MNETTYKKQFGLVLPSAAKKVGGLAAPKTAVRPLSIFQEEDDELQEEGEKLDTRALVNRRIQAEAAKYEKMSKIDETYKKALEEDPSVFEWDSIYDDMQAKKNPQRGQSEASEPKKAKYVEALIHMAKDRKAERERVILRNIQRERQKDGEEYGDKEEFVTSAYKQKLEEDKLQEERDKLIAAKDDISKKKDMSGFYRNLLTSNEAFGGGSHGLETSATKPAKTTTEEEPAPKRLKTESAFALHEDTTPAPAPALVSKESDPKEIAAPPITETPAPAAVAEPAQPVPKVTPEERQTKALSAKERYLLRKQQQQSTETSSQ